jgi:hypothetical protein
MPELREVFEMTTKQMDPDVGSWGEQQQRQRKRARNRKLGAIAVAAAVGVVAAVLILTNRPGESGTGTVPAGEPSPSTTTSEPAGPVGTVMFDGSTCSLELAAGQSGPEATFESGPVVFEVVNATDRPAQFDSWELLEGYGFGQFESVLDRGLRRLDAGKTGKFPEVGGQVLALGNTSLPANGSGFATFTVVPGREYAMTCLQRVPGQKAFSWGPVGPITAA